MRDHHYLILRGRVPYLSPQYAEKCSNKVHFPLVLKVEWREQGEIVSWWCKTTTIRFLIHENPYIPEMTPKYAMWRQFYANFI